MYKSFFFGDIDLNEFEGYYEAEFEYENQIIELDLNINKQEVPKEKQLIKIDDFLKNLKKHEDEIKLFIYSDFDNEGISKEYIEFYTDEFEEYELETLIDKNNKDKTVEEQLISKVYIQRIGFYPNDNIFAIFDYYVNHKISDQILVVVIGNDMNYGITWES